MIIMNQKDKDCVILESVGGSGVGNGTRRRRGGWRARPGGALAHLATKRNKTEPNQTKRNVKCASSALPCCCGGGVSPLTRAVWRPSAKKKKQDKQTNKRNRAETGLSVRPVRVTRFRDAPEEEAFLEIRSTVDGNICAAGKRPSPPHPSSFASVSRHTLG